jgi:hypothetical protein
VTFPALRQFGEEAFYAGGLACLEYPPTLITSLDEVLFVVDFLSNSVSQSQDK